jgi:hypothetical protein
VEFQKGVNNLDGPSFSTKSFAMMGVLHEEKKESKIGGTEKDFSRLPFLKWKYQKNFAKFEFYLFRKKNEQKMHAFSHSNFQHLKSTKETKNNPILLVLISGLPDMLTFWRKKIEKSASADFLKKIFALFL